MTISRIKTNSIEDSAITGSKVATGGIATVDMADGSVTSLKIADGGVGTADIANSAVTPAKLSSDAQYMGFKNRIINGAMMIDQRNGGSAQTGVSASAYCLDRWKFDIGGTGTFTLQQSSIAPAGFSNSLSITCTTAQASPAVLYAEQKIEGFNLQDLAYNTSSAASTTVSFWVRSNKTGTFVALLYNTSASRMVGRTYTINATNTWEQKTVTFPGDTAAAIPNSNANGLEIRFWLAAGTSWSSGTLPSIWAADVTANEAAGQTVNLADTIGNTFYITGVQLEKGSTPTAFDYRPYGTELALCQRYYQQISSSTSSGLYMTYGVGFSAATTYGFAQIPILVEMRSAPTLTNATVSQFRFGFNACTSLAVNSPSTKTVSLRCDVASGLTSGQGMQLDSNNNQTSWIGLSAEL
jgi:hypothetical protein